MDIVLKGFLQGSIPVVVFVGGAHHLTKKFKASKPVLYYGSLLAGLGLAYAVVEGKIKAPFMNAETEHECDYDCTCAHDDGVCAFDCIHCEDEKNAENEIDRYYEHREEILEVKARLLEEEDYEDDQEAENDAIYEVFSKYYPEIYESEVDKEGQFYDDLEEKIQAKRKEIEDLKEYMAKVAYGRSDLLELDSLEEELAELEEMEFMGAETFEARQNKDGTIVLTENEWDSCLHLPHKDHYLFRNKELKLIKHLKNGVKFEVVRIHSDDVVAIIREYEALLKKTGRLKRMKAKKFEAQRMMTTCDGCGMTEEGHMDYCSHCDMDFCDSCDHFGYFTLMDVCEDSVNSVIEDSPYIARKGERR